MSSINGVVPVDEAIFSDKKAFALGQSKCLICYRNIYSDEPTVTVLARLGNRLATRHLVHTKCATNLILQKDRK